MRHLKYSKRMQGISSKEDIIKEVSERLGKDYKLVERILEHSIKRIREIIDKDEETVRISLPNLGTLKANYHVTHEVASRGNKTAQKRRKYLSDNYERTKNFDVPLVEFLYASKTNSFVERGDITKNYDKMVIDIQEKNDEQVKKYFK